MPISISPVDQLHWSLFIAPSSLFDKQLLKYSPNLLSEMVYVYNYLQVKKEGFASVTANIRHDTSVQQGNTLGLRCSSNIFKKVGVGGVRPDCINHEL